MTCSPISTIAEVALPSAQRALCVRAVLAPAPHARSFAEEAARMSPPTRIIAAGAGPRVRSISFAPAGPALVTADHGRPTAAVHASIWLRTRPIVACATIRVRSARLASAEPARVPLGTSPVRANACESRVTASIAAPAGTRVVWQKSVTLAPARKGARHHFMRATARASTSGVIRRIAGRAAWRAPAASSARQGCVSVRPEPRLAAGNASRSIATQTLVARADTAAASAKSARRASAFKSAPRALPTAAVRAWTSSPILAIAARARTPARRGLPARMERAGARAEYSAVGHVSIPQLTRHTAELATMPAVRTQPARTPPAHVSPASSNAAARARQCPKMWQTVEPVVDCAPQGKSALPASAFPAARPERPSAEPGARTSPRIRQTAARAATNARVARCATLESAPVLPAHHRAMVFASTFFEAALIVAHAECCAREAPSARTGAAVARLACLIARANA